MNRRRYWRHSPARSRRQAPAPKGRRIAARLDADEHRCMMYECRRIEIAEDEEGDEDSGHTRPPQFGNAHTRNGAITDAWRLTPPSVSAVKAGSCADHSRLVACQQAAVFAGRNPGPVPQPGRERPPFRYAFASRDLVGGGRSRPGCLPRTRKRSCVPLRSPRWFPSGSHGLFPTDAGPDARRDVVGESARFKNDCHSFPCRRPWTTHLVSFGTLNARAAPGIVVRRAPLDRGCTT